MSYHGLGDMGDDAYDAGSRSFVKSISKGGKPWPAVKGGAKLAGHGAAITGGTIGGAAACAATGVGAPFAPLCGIIGGAIANAIASALDPLVEKLGQAFADLFDPNKAKAEAERRRREAGMTILKAELEIQKTTEHGGQMLMDSVRTLRDMHQQLGLPGPYSWRQATEALAYVGLRLDNYRTVSGDRELDLTDPFTGELIPGGLTSLRWVQHWESMVPKDADGNHCAGTRDPAQANRCKAAATVLLADYDAWIKELQVATAVVMTAMTAQAVALRTQHEIDLARRRAMTLREQFQSAQERAHPGSSGAVRVAPTKGLGLVPDSWGAAPWLVGVGGAVLGGWLVLRRE